MYKSEWNDRNELMSLLIFKRLESKKFPRGLQIKLCSEMEIDTKLSKYNISAKVSNYKSVANINKPSNASYNTKRIYLKYKDYNIFELEEVIKDFKI